MHGIKRNYKQQKEGFGGFSCVVFFGDGKKAQIPLEKGPKERGSWSPKEVWPLSSPESRLVERDGRWQRRAKALLPQAGIAPLKVLRSSKEGFGPSALPALPQPFNSARAVWQWSQQSSEKLATAPTFKHSWSGAWHLLLPVLNSQASSSGWGGFGFVVVVFLFFWMSLLLSSLHHTAANPRSHLPWEWLRCEDYFFSPQGCHNRLTHQTEKQMSKVLLCLKTPLWEKNNDNKKEEMLMEERHFFYHPFPLLFSLMVTPRESIACEISSPIPPQELKEGLTFAWLIRIG